MSILPQPLRHSLDWLARLLVPCGSCLLCTADSAGSPLCPACIADLPRLPSGRCPQCGEAIPVSERCGACLKKPPHFDACHALFPYQFPTDRLIQALKYGHQLALAKWFGQGLAAALSGTAAELIVPLPLHPQRLAERGFNQAMEIARQLEKALALPVDRKTLVRTRITPPQAEQPFKARRANVRGAFECRGDLSGKRILLIDDVLTTGATADECARVLKGHGAARVEVAVVARAFRH